MRGGYCYKPEQRERAPCRARTACWYGSSVGVKRVHRSEKREGGGGGEGGSDEEENRTTEQEGMRGTRVQGPESQKPSERASQPASQPVRPASQPSQRKERGRR